MNGELVRIEAEDGLELVGFYASPEGRPPRRAVVHTHGLAGNFYENRFVSEISRAVVEKGLAFLSFNNRGHDYRSDNLRGGGLETTSYPGGASFDVFQDCVLDLGGCVRYLAGRGHSEFYFEGHSLGTNKVVYYLTERREPRAVGAILISPPDIFALRAERTGGQDVRIVEEARGLVARGEGETLMDVGYVVPFSATTVVSLYGDSGASDVFPFRLGDGGSYSRLRSLTVPALVTFGTVDEAVTVDVREAAELLRAHAAEGAGAEVRIFEGANHVYWGFEHELAQSIAEFVEP